MRKKNKLLLSILWIRLHVRIHIGNNFPDHENNIYKFVIFVLLSKIKKISSIQKWPFFLFFFHIFEHVFNLKKFFEGTEHT